MSESDETEECITSMANLIFARFLIPYWQAVYLARTALRIHDEVQESEERLRKAVVMYLDGA